MRIDEEPACDFRPLSFREVQRWAATSNRGRVRVACSFLSSAFHERQRMVAVCEIVLLLSEAMDRRDSAEKDWEREDAQDDCDRFLFALKEMASMLPSLDGETPEKQLLQARGELGFGQEGFR